MGTTGQAPEANAESKEDKVNAQVYWTRKRLLKRAERKGQFGDEWEDKDNWTKENKANATDDEVSRRYVIATEDEEWEPLSSTSPLRSRSVPL